MIAIDISSISLPLRQDKTGVKVFDPVRKKWVQLTPEEHVRQYIIRLLSEKCRCPFSRMAVEKKLSAALLSLRYDLLLYSPQHDPWMLVECKKPEVLLSKDTLYQLLKYQKSLQCPYGIITNGHQMYCAHINAETGMVSWLDTLPAYQ